MASTGGVNADLASTTSYLAGGGVTGEIIRNFDWASTPIGSPESWPSPLKTAISLLLNSAGPVYIGWGPDLISFYNDGYLPIVGTKHSGIGKPFRELWAEIWEEFQPIVQATMEGRAQHFIDRPIALEGRPGLPVGYFTFSYTPLRLESGEIAGFYCAATETTIQLEIEESLARSEARLRRATRAANMFVWEIEPKTGFTTWGDDTAAVLGMTEDQLSAASGDALFFIAEAERERVTEEFLGTIRRKDATFNLEFEGKEGRYWRAQGTLLYDQQAKLERIVGITKDVTAEQIARRRDAFLLRLEDALRSCEDAERSQDLAAELLGLELKASRVLYAELDEATTEFKVRSEYVASDLKSAVGAYPFDPSDSLLRAYSSGEPLVVGDVRMDPRTAHLLERADLRATETGSVLNIPLMRDGRLVGVLATTTREPRNWRNHEVELARLTAERTWATVERARAERALRESEAKARQVAAELEAIYNAAPVGLTVLDRNLRYQRINELLAEINGRPAADHIGKTVREVVPNLADQVEEALRRVLEGEEVWGLELSGETPSQPGVRRTWRENWLPMRNSAGEIVGVAISAEEVTKAKEAEELLRASEAQLRAVIEAAPVGLVFADATGRITGGNARVEEIIGYPVLPSGDLDAYDEWVSFHPDGRPVEAREYPLARVLLGKEERAELLVHYQRGDGTRRWVRFSAAPIRDEDGSIIGGVVASIDVDKEMRLTQSLGREVERVVAEREVAQEALRQSQKLESMGQLTGGVAHDFNNLLTPIIGSLDYLQRQHASDPRTTRLLDGALQSAERAKVLVQRLLAFARRQPLQPTAVDVAQIVRNMVDLVATTTGPRIRLELDVEPGLPPAHADANQLELALLNLCVNARDAMPDGGTLRLSVRQESGASDGKGSLVLAVADDGVGMDEETARRCVEPFYSTKGVGKGTGLGLSMVHGLAAQLGGELRVRSRARRGTTIELSLPISSDGLEVHSAAAQAAHDPARGRILLVDDEELVRMSTAAMLAELGFEVVEADCGEAALDLVHGGLRPDLLVTDHLMPGISGTDLAVKLRRDMPALPVLVVSGYADTDGLTPAFPHLAKPFRQTELAESLKALRGEGPASG